MALGDQDFVVERLTAVEAPANGTAPVSAPSPEPDSLAATMDVLDTRTIEILKLRRAFRVATRRRGWLVRRALLIADIVG
jgi:hypothetical protein